ncbi:unnamed protein product [Hymenolepis diminuta]|uniref:EF-hand domain-containing protein n=1 Tax=Hymenolepis diminuta TaxID=6216 RepID=A0A0R3SLY8_HYMDI|nr:unnamed protein product [Hymenolepis diminuta]
MIGPTVVAREMPAEESTPELRTKRLFAAMDRDGDELISYADFVEGVRADAEVLSLLRNPVPCSYNQESPSETPPPHTLTPPQSMQFEPN